MPARVGAGSAGVCNQFLRRVGAQLAADKQRLARVDLDARIVQGLAHAVRQRSEVEAGGHACAILARADQPAIGTIAQDQAQRIEQDGLAGTGLAGKHAEAACEIQVKRLDQNDVTDGKPGEHVRFAF